MQQLTYGRSWFALTISDRCLTLTSQGENLLTKVETKREGGGD